MSLDTDEQKRGGKGRKMLVGRHVWAGKLSSQEEQALDLSSEGPVL